ncbi:MAG: lipid-A-disaccharide synthase [Acidobacteriota bacterium]
MAPHDAAPQDTGSPDTASDSQVLVVAGETSGDLHAARLVSALADRRPELRFFGLGSHELKAAGCSLVADSAEISVVGIVEVLKIYRRAREIFEALLAEVDRRQASLAILVDFPEFNMRIARELKKRGVRVIYYISPQIWAWRKGRVKAIARDVDLMLVLFPFEVDFYRGHGVDVVHVGHPLVDEVPRRPTAWETAPPSAMEPVTLALLPGSRRSEVRALLPQMAGAALQLRQELESRGRALRVRLIQAPSIADELLAEILGPDADFFERIRSDRFDAIAGSHLALCASGTATVEVALLEVPMVVLYRLKWTSYVLGRLLVDLPHFCMVNLVLDERVVPELLQRETAPPVVTAEALRILDDPAALAKMRGGLARLRPALGSSGASERAAEAISRRIGGLSAEARSGEGA